MEMGILCGRKGRRKKLKLARKVMAERHWRPSGRVVAGMQSFTDEAVAFGN